MIIRLLILFLGCFSLTGFSQSSSPPDLEAYFSAMIVKDIDQSIQWYSDILGFEILNQTESEKMGFEQANLKRGAILIELISLQSAVSPSDVIPDYSSKTKLHGFFKTGFLVGDFDQWMDHLNRLKVDFHGRVVIDQLSGKRMVIVKDPDGNRIQIFEK